MTNARLAQIYRELAELDVERARLLTELAEAHALMVDEWPVDATGAIAPKPRKSKPRRRSFPAPLKPPNDLDRMRARKMLRKQGMTP